MKKSLSFIVLSAIFLFLMPLILAQSVINVPANFSTIQEAINVAVDGDIINVSAGTYTNSVIINKSVTLNGNGIVNQTASITIAVNNTAINHFTFSGDLVSGFHLNLDTNNAHSGINITDNIFNGAITTGYVMRVGSNKDNLKIIGNTFTESTAGKDNAMIFLGSGGSDILIQGNTFKDIPSTYNPRMIQHNGKYDPASNRTVNMNINNNIINLTGHANGTTGIEIRFADYVRISNNTLIDSNASGTSTFFHGGIVLASVVSASGQSIVELNAVNGFSRGISTRRFSTGDGFSDNITITNNTVTNSIRQTNSNQATTGIGLYLTGVTNLLAKRNTITGHPYIGILVPEFVSGSDANVITNMVMSDKNNILSNVVDINNSATTNINAVKNYWGSINPNFTSIIVGNVTHFPFYIDSVFTMLLSNSFGENQTIADNKQEIVSENVTEIIVPVGSPLEEVIANITNEKKDINLSLAELINSTGEVELVNNFILIRQTSTFNYTAKIPSGTVISGGSDWDGKINLPTIKNIADFTAPSGSVDVVIDVGSGIEINFSNAVKITIGGKAGKRGAWARGTSALTEITTICNNADAPTNINPNAPRECYADSGNDLVIWSFHFTQFSAYTPSAPAPSPSPAPSGGGGGGGGGGGVYVPTTPSEPITYRLNLIKGQVYQLNINGDFHEYSITQIDVAEKTAEFVFESGKTILLLPLNMPILFNYNNDNYDDLEITLLNIFGAELVEVRIKTIHQLILAGIPEKITEEIIIPTEEKIEMPEEEIEVPIEEPKEVPQKPKYKFGVGQFLLVVIVILIIVGIFYYIRKKDKEKEEELEKQDANNKKRNK